MREPPNKLTVLARNAKISCSTKVKTQFWKSTILRLNIYLILEVKCIDGM